MNKIFSQIIFEKIFVYTPILYSFNLDLNMRIGYLPIFPTYPWYVNMVGGFPYVNLINHDEVYIFISNLVK